VSVNWLELSGHLAKFYKGLLLSQGFVATPRALAAVAPEILADSRPAQRWSARASRAAAEVLVGKMPDAAANSTEDGADRDLIVRIQNHDKDAFYQLYIRYHRKLAGFLTRLTQSPQVAEIIINDTLWVVWSRADSFDDASRASTWIMGIAYRRSLKSLRRAARRGRSVREQQEFKRALERLPLKLRFTFEFAYCLGQSCPEIAQIMECSIDTVTARMRRARRQLRSAVAAGSRLGAEVAGCTLIEV
jgi:RNA polymerase sigma-70 factor (ECF subfamily)